MIEFPFGRHEKQAPPRRTVTVSHWLPRQADTFHLDDVAVLRLEGTLPEGVRVLPIGRRRRSLPVAVQMWGPVPDRPFGGHVGGQLMGAVERSRLQIDQHLHGVFKVQRGFSGGPVWHTADGTLAGLLHAVGLPDDATDAYVLDADLIRRVLSPGNLRRRVLVTSAALAVTVAGVATVLVSGLMPGPTNGLPIRPSESPGPGAPSSAHRSSGSRPQVTPYPPGPPGSVGTPADSPHPDEKRGDGQSTASKSPTSTVTSTTPASIPTPETSRREPAGGGKTFDFTGGVHGWSTVAPRAYVDGQGYRLTAPAPNRTVMATAPVGSASRRVRIVAVATLTRGSEGGWGVWCRHDDGKVPRYRFAVTHNRAAYINATSTGSPWSEGAFEYQYETVKITAECQDAANDDVQLDMTADNPDTRTGPKSVDTVYDDAVALRSLRGTVGIYVYSDPGAGRSAELVVKSFQVREF